MRIPGSFLQLLRRNSVRELARSIAEVGADPTVAGGETVPAIEAYGQSLGLASFGQGGDELEGQIRPRYTARVKDLTTELGYLGGYNIFTPVWPTLNWQGCGARSERPRRPCGTGSRSTRQSRASMLHMPPRTAS